MLKINCVFLNWFKGSRYKVSKIEPLARIPRTIIIWTKNSLLKFKLKLEVRYLLHHKELNKKKKYCLQNWNLIVAHRGNTLIIFYISAATMIGVVYSECRIPKLLTGACRIVTYTFSGLWAPGPGLLVLSPGNWVLPVMLYAGLWFLKVFGSTLLCGHKM